MRAGRYQTEEEISELNLVPYMDIMVNLIIFMLFTMTSFIEMKVINVSVPEQQEVNDDDDDATQKPPPLAIVVGVVHRRGFTVSIDGTFLPGPQASQPTIPCLGNGNYDFPALQSKLSEIKGTAPDITSVTLVADKPVDYQSLVRTMDILRRDPGGRPMFPDVLLGVL